MSDLSRPVVPVILSGGAGSRLWPLSTDQRPKQFLTLHGTASLFRQTLDRLADPALYSPPVIVAAQRHAALVEADVGTRDHLLVLEPVARNTAAAIGLAAMAARAAHGGDALLLVCPSDHLIADAAAFHAAVAAGRAAAADGWLVTFGIVPTGPETGYGYLERGEPVGDAAVDGDGDDAPKVRRVARFVEKPDRARAEAMIADGSHCWNAGIFLFSADTLLAALERFAPAIHHAVRDSYAAATSEGSRILPDRAALEDCPDLSIDYAVMERADAIAMVAVGCGWSDVGSWDALADLSGDARPAMIGPVAAREAERCYVHSDGVRVTMLGVSDLIVVAAGNEVLIMPRGRSQEVRGLRGLIDAAGASVEEPAHD